MNKKTLIGSICSVIILVLVSFSSVVNARSSEANTVLQRIQDRLNDTDWEPGILLQILLWILLYILFSIAPPTGWPTP